MQYDILLTKTSGNGYIARPLLWPEIVASASNEASDPWLRAAGMWKNIPEEEWNSFQNGVEAARQAVNREVELSQFAG